MRLSLQLKATRFLSFPGEAVVKTLKSPYTQRQAIVDAFRASAGPKTDTVQGSRKLGQANVSQSHTILFFSWFQTCNSIPVFFLPYLNGWHLLSHLILISNEHQVMMIFPLSSVVEQGHPVRVSLQLESDHECPDTPPKDYRDGVVHYVTIDDLDP
jgi:hypothetical protein